MPPQSPPFLRNHPVPASPVFLALAAVLAGWTLVSPAPAEAQTASASASDVVAWWSFDELGDGGTVLDRSGTRRDTVLGHRRLADGVVDRALLLDGYTTRVVRPAPAAPRLEGPFTLEGWLALATYPWNDAPVVDRSVEERAGYRLDVGPRGELVLGVAADGRWYRAVSDDYTVPIRRWVHVAGVYDPARGLALYADGEEVARLSTAPRENRSGRALTGRLDPADTDLLLGMAHVPRRPSNGHRHDGNQPAWYGLDGLLDEVRVHARALSAAEVETLARAHEPGPPALAPRVLPRGPAGRGPFGAFRTTLSYDAAWDDLWSVGPGADVVVRFPDSDVRLVFWRGTQYSPAWVTENNLWMADQSVETWTEGQTWEHMNDFRNRYSRVEVLESHAARAVVHWRYALVNVEDELWKPDPRTGRGAWIDEYYTIYPDRTAVRLVTWTRGALGSTVQFQESIPLTGPGQLQGDVVERTYVTVGNLAGERATFAYVEDPAPEGSRPVPDSLVLQRHDLKARNDPFIVFETGDRMRYLRDIDVGALSRPGSSNHWPVAQIPSDGRTSQAPDRPGHFLGFPISRPPVHEGEDGRDYVRSLYGMGERTFDDLVVLARAWNRPPELEVREGAFVSAGYDRSQRAHRLRRGGAGQGSGTTEAAGGGTAGGPSSLTVRIDASPERPVFDLALVLEGWGEADALVRVEGEGVEVGARVRTGHEQRLEGTDLVVFVPVRTERPLTVVVTPVER